MDSLVSKIMDEDAAGLLADVDFDDALWLALCDRIGGPKSLANLPHPVGVYYATRLVEWEVGNGGFAQAAFNIPHWIDAAITGFEELAKPAVAALIREAKNLVQQEAQRLGAAREGGIENAFAYFSDSPFGALDSRIEEVGFWSDSERLAYVRANRDAFRLV
jgi:hypothetical protein